MPTDAVIIRLATEADLGAINDIYNHYVIHSTCTYQEQPESLDSRIRWFQQHDKTHPVIVAVEAGQVVGWGSLSVYHPRSAYRRTVEDSIYIHHQHHRRGIGSRLLQELIAAARQLGYHALIAGADTEQAGSLALHAKFGFETIGRFRQVGFKFDRWLDVIYMELILDAKS